MSLKTLPLRGPAARLAPRRRTPLERLVSALEFAAIARAIARVTPSTRRRRSPGPRPKVIALAAGGLAAVAVGAILGRRRSSARRRAADSEPVAFTGTVNGDEPASATTSPVAPGADPEGAKLDIDAPNAGATGNDPSPAGS